jgi:hypothetical protein
MNRTRSVKKRGMLCSSGSVITALVMDVCGEQSSAPCIRRLGEKACAAFAMNGASCEGQLQGGEGRCVCDDVCMLLVVVVLPVYVADQASQ